MSPARTPPAPPRDGAAREGALFVQALHALVEVNGVPQSALADHTGVSQGYVSKILCGKQLPKGHLRERLADFFHLSYREMLDIGRERLAQREDEEYSMPGQPGDPMFPRDAVREDISSPQGVTYPCGERALLKNLLRDIKAREVHQRYYTEVPLREATGSMGGGSTETGTRTITYLSFRTEWIRSKGNPEFMSVIRAFGDSMAPTIADGCVVLIDESRRQFVTNKVYYIRHNGQMYIKRLIGNARDIRIVSDQDQACIPVCEADDFEIIGRCIWMARDIE
ncbi:XRE family transcriptional regulator [Desulfolutivibrio sulfoxidireducens]|uniref:XRE family transcriptional regulator n=1 Tax=Desulfolutivibrio sulfoxidireducens TaxID=2773299 RepID=UPI00159EB860|nr:XRE family transcriptional regulator [Desulfolutivibrio sulfoxidireducens]QLA17724.1 XRE family transcriptional regulator [Desulfolutivibrio sulfoxidireducens]QLA21298.1 XRE family transcriptional regulator [Desulfolutivibrio sulfoxidireducens]